MHAERALSMATAHPKHLLQPYINPNPQGKLQRYATTKTLALAVAGPEEEPGEEEIGGGEGAGRQ